MKDETILDLFFARDERAIGEVADAYGTRLLSLSRRITGSELDAEECVNDVWMQAWGSIPPLRPKHLFGYLCKLARQLSLDVLDKRNAAKRSGKTVELSNELCECLPDPTELARADSQAIRDALRAFLDSESDENRYIFLHRYFFAESISEIAEGLGKSEASISSSLYRARGRLKTRLEKEGIMV